MLPVTVNIYVEKLTNKALEESMVTVLEAERTIKHVSRYDGVGGNRAWWRVL